MKIKLPEVSLLRSLAFKEYFLYSWYFLSIFLFQTPSWYGPHHKHKNIQKQSSRGVL